MSERKDPVIEKMLEAQVAAEPKAEPEIQEQTPLESLVSETVSETKVEPERPKEEVRVQEEGPNFKRLKEEKAKAERERDEMMRLLAQMNPNKPVKVEEEENLDLDVNDNDLIEGKHVTKLQKQIKKLESTIRGFQQQTQTQMVETRLKSQYPDFDQVLSKENVEALRALHPEIVETLRSSPDDYSRGVSAYTIIKKMGIHQDPAPFLADKERISANANRPKSAATVTGKASNSPLSGVNVFEGKMTPDMQKRLYEEMLAYRNQG